jgi:hypothetical protein
MKLKTSACVILVTVLIAAIVRSTGHHVPSMMPARGPIASEPRVGTSEALDVPQVLTDEDIGPVAISVKDNPAEIVNKAAWALIADNMHSCTSERIDRGSLGETLMEVAGPDRVHLLNRQSGNSQPPYEVIVIGTNQYHRDSDGP